uniref:Putative secreted protein n=1 Tax=Amblyomma triste TaxID=251400 RepID=A0A023GAU2_AMBTT
MTPVKFFWAMACIAASSATGFEYRTDTPCDFSGIDLDGPISRMLTSLPEYMMRDSPEFRAEFAGIEFFGLKISGLNKVRRYGAVIPFCINGTRMIQVEFAQDGDVSLSVPWKTCTGAEGELQLRASVSRFTTLFRIEAPSLGQEVTLELAERTLPVSTEELMLRVRGGGMFPAIVSRYLSMAFPAVLRAMWYEQFFYNFDRSIRQALA